MSSLRVRDNRCIAGLASCRWDREDHSDRQCLFNLCFSHKEIPHVPRIRNSHGNGLCGINNAPSACRQDKVQFLFPAKPDALSHHFHIRIGFHAAQFHVFNLICLQRTDDPVIQAIFFDMSSSIVKQDPFAVLFNFFPHAVLCVFSEDKIRRTDKSEVLHDILFFLLIPLSLCSFPCPRKAPLLQVSSRSVLP